MSTADSLSTKRTGAGWGARLVLFLPPGLLVVLLGLWFANEYRESLAVQARIRTFPDVHFRADAEDAKRALSDPIRTAETLRWLNLLRQAERLRFRYSSEYLSHNPYAVAFNSSDFLLVKAGGDFEKSNAAYEDFLLHMQPILEQLDELSKVPQPIWTPKVPFGFGGSWYSADQVSQLLYLELFLAIRKQDRPRILAGLHRLMDLERQLAEVIPWSRFPRALSRLQNRYLCLSFCLMVPGWTADELTQLERFLTPAVDYTKLWLADIDHWSNSVMNVDQELYDHYGGANFMETLFVPIASGQSEALRWFDKLRELKMDDLSQAVSELKRLSPSNRNVLSPDITLQSQKFLSEIASLRQLVLCGIAVRKYRMAYGRWPAELREAVPPGLGQNLIFLSDGQPVGYGFRDEYAEIWIPPAIEPDDSRGKNQESASGDLRRFRTMILDVPLPQPPR
jgi:hypothetical protein